MGTFHVTIIGHLDLAKKPKELPDTIRQLYVDEVETPAQLIERVHGRLKEITDVGGMGCRITPENVEEGKKQKSVFVFSHLISYLETEIKAVTGDMPQPNPDSPGEFVDKQGNKVGLQ